MVYFYVVQFVEEETVEVAPASWLFDNNTKCNWPENINDKIKLHNLVQKGCQPTENTRNISWKIFQCRVLLGTDDYFNAKKGAEKASAALAEAKSDFDLTDVDTNTAKESRKLRKHVQRSNYKLHRSAENIPEILISVEQDSSNNQREHLEQDALPGNIFQDILPDELNVSSEPLDRVPGFCSHIEGIQVSPPPSDVNLRLDQLTSDIQNFRLEFQNFESVIIENLLKITRELDHVSRIIGRHFVSSLQQDELELPTGILLPLQEARHMAILQQWLANNDKQIKLANYLRGIGGSDLKDCVKRILERLFSPELARGVNFIGANNKISFKKHNLRSCLIAALRTSPESAIPTEAEVDKLVQKWFGGSCDRNGGRAARKKTQNETEELPYSN